MKKVVFVLVAAGVAAVAFWMWRASNQAVAVPVVAVARGEFSDEVSTNGRIEPSEWASARAEREGLVIQVPMAKGQAVARGVALAVLDSKDAQAELASALARMEEARATITSLEGGGRKQDLVEIDQSLRQRRSEKAQVEKDLGVAERLAAKNAGTRDEARVLRDRVESINLQIAALEARRPVLVGASEIVSAQTRLREAQSAAEQARRKIELSTIRSPIEGTIYQLDARLGAYLAPGALVANVGRTEVLKVIVYVDEPELGRVTKGMPVKISWDALEGKVWTGAVEKTPTQIVPLGTRQVGEVECRIDNQAGELLPGTNVNVLIETNRQKSTLLVPKEAMRTVDAVEGVYVVESGMLSFRKVKFGVRNVASSVVLEGVKEGELVALGPDASLKAGQRVEILKK